MTTPAQRFRDLLRSAPFVTLTVSGPGFHGALRAPADPAASAAALSRLPARDSGGKGTPRPRGAAHAS